MSSTDAPSYFHCGGTTPLIGETIDTFVRRVAERFPDHDAIVSVSQETRLSYATLNEHVEAVARGLLGLGFTKGDRVGIWSTDNTEWVTLQLATARIGTVLVSINPAYRAGELRHALKLARVQCLIMIPSFRSSNYVGLLCEVCPELRQQSGPKLKCQALPDLRHVIVFDPEHTEATKRPIPAMMTWQELLEIGLSIGTEQMADRAALVDPDDPVNIQFTSGTTGFPKAVVLTHHNLLNNGYAIGEIMRFTERDRLCVPLPFYHCFGMVVSNLACLTHGAAIVIPAPHFDARATLAAIECERCTAVHGVPTMFIAELEHPDFGEFDLSSLRTGIMAGAPCPPPIVRRVIEEMGCREILIAYGQTEASPVTHLTRPDDDFTRKVETVGTNLPHQEVKIIDKATHRMVPHGKAGEICFRGYHVMRGYFEQPEATAEVIDEAGWLHSGDLGVMDDDGYVRITGRLKDMIIRGGENIYPAEIEAHFYELPQVAQIAVFGIPDPRLGETVGAWIKLHEGIEANAEELRTAIRGQIAHFKVPRHIWIVNDFPMTVTGKIQKYRIKEIVSKGAECIGEYVSHPVAGEYR